MPLELHSCPHLVLADEVVDDLVQQVDLCLSILVRFDHTPGVHSHRSMEEKQPTESTPQPHKHQLKHRRTRHSTGRLWHNHNTSTTRCHEPSFPCPPLLLPLQVPAHELVLSCAEGVVVAGLLPCRLRLRLKGGGEMGKQRTQGRRKRGFRTPYFVCVS